MLRHELDEIEAANLDPDEEKELQSERNRLANSEQLAQLANEAAQGLDADERGAVDRLMDAAGALQRLADIDAQMKDRYDLAESLAAQAQELALDLTRYATDAEYDPQRLNELEERLELIKGLKRRHRVDSVTDILAYARRAQNELDGIDQSDERLAQLAAREDALLRQIGDISWRLSQARAAAGEKLGAAVIGELADLRMERARFEVRLAQASHPAGCIVGNARYKFDAKGLDDVEFLLSANPGEPLRPLAKVASGGEAARIMLALKRVLTEADQVPVLIFDEVDQGIGGRLGAVVGEKLWSLSDAHQVLCVTHLPQLAGYADAHFQAQKDMDAVHAATRLRALASDEERVRELADMLGTAGAARGWSLRGSCLWLRGRERLSWDSDFLF